MDSKDVKSIMELFSTLSIHELKYDNGEHSLYLKKKTGRVVKHLQPEVETTLPIQEVTEKETLDIEEEGGTFITSPIVGTYYSAPNPNSEAYVKVGDRIEKGQVLCIVEAMKLMNEIQAEVSGTIHRILVENAQPVEYGQKLFVVK